MVFNVTVEEILENNRVQYVEWLDFEAESLRQAELFVFRFIAHGDYDNDKYRVYYNLIPVSNVFNRKKRCFDIEYPEADQFQNEKFKKIIGED